MDLMPMLFLAIFAKITMVFMLPIGKNSLENGNGNVSWVDYYYKQHQTLPTSKVEQFFILDSDAAVQQQAPSDFSRKYCRLNGTRIAMGMQWTMQNVRYKCAPNGFIEMIGCETYDGTPISRGERYYADDGVIHECVNEEGQVWYQWTEANTGPNHNNENHPEQNAPPARNSAPFWGE